jgi:hypothetical protein
MRTLLPSRNLSNLRLWAASVSACVLQRRQIGRVRSASTSRSASAVSVVAVVFFVVVLEIGRDVFIACDNRESNTINVQRLRKPEQRMGRIGRPSSSSSAEGDTGPTAKSSSLSESEKFSASGCTHQHQRATTNARRSERRTGEQNNWRCVRTSAGGPCMACVSAVTSTCCCCCIACRAKSTASCQATQNAANAGAESPHRQLATRRASNLQRVLLLLRRDLRLRQHGILPHTQSRQTLAERRSQGRRINQALPAPQQ